VHEVGLQHGEGRLWCLDCHAGDARDHLRTLQDDSVDFNDAWIVCGQCHAARKKDWFFGAHGKRVSNWVGEAERYNCTHCHDPHRPAFIERKPQAKPGLRAGLHPMKRQTTRQPPVWEKKLAQATEVKKHE
jgi:formate-dependent nitrite reductase cytochrome c552 subunit